MLQSLAGSSCVRLVEQHRSAWCFALLVLGYLLYLVFGAVVFSSVELPYEDLLRQELGKLKQRFLVEHACLSEQQLEQFLLRVLEASNYGVSVLSNASGNWNWDFTSSLFFASTVLSTTGKAAAAAGPIPRGAGGLTERGSSGCRPVRPGPGAASRGAAGPRRAGALRREGDGEQAGRGRSDRGRASRGVVCFPVEKPTAGWASGKSES